LPFLAPSIRANQVEKELLFGYAETVKALLVTVSVCFVRHTNLNLRGVLFVRRSKFQMQC
jgi:hypothetical protein